MKTLYLTDEQHQLLLEVLESQTHDLRDEISHTVTPEYRAFLKQRRGLIIHLADEFKKSLREEEREVMR